MNHEECRDCEKCESRIDSVFSELPPSLLKKLNEAKVTNTYLPNQSIFYQDNVPTGLYCIASGTIKVTNLSPSGKEQLLKVYKPGDILGYRSLFASQRQMGTAQAIESATICFVDKNTIFELIRESPELAMKLIGKLSKEVGQAQNRVISNAYKSIEERFAEQLLFLNETYGKKTGNDIWEITLHLKREEMAQLVGTSVETIIRILSQFEDDGLILRKGRIIQILKKDQLVERANLMD